MALLRVWVDEDREMAGGVVEPRELKPRVPVGARRRLCRERLRVAGGECCADLGATVGIVDRDEAPWLAEAYRRREVRQIEQFGQ